MTLLFMLEDSSQLGSRGGRRYYSTLDTLVRALELQIVRPSTAHLSVFSDEPGELEAVHPKKLAEAAKPYYSGFVYRVPRPADSEARHQELSDYFNAHGKEHPDVREWEKNLKKARDAWRTQALDELATALLHE